MEDREATFSYIAADSFDAAVRVDDEVERQCELLASFPMSGRAGRLRGTRELVIRSTPYIAIYKLGVEEVLILRVIHAARRWPKGAEVRQGL